MTGLKIIALQFIAASAFRTSPTVDKDESNSATFNPIFEAAKNVTCYESNRYNLIISSNNYFPKKTAILRGKNTKNISITFSGDSFNHTAMVSPGENPCSIKAFACALT